MHRAPLAASSSSPPGGRAGPTARLALLGVLWGITFPVVRLGVAAGVPPFLLLTIDLALATAILAGIAGRYGGPRPDRRSFALSGLVGALLIGANNVLLFWGVQFTTGGLAAVVYATAPLVAVLAGLGLGRTVGLGAVGALALVLGLLGVVALGFASAGTALLSNGWAVAAVFGGASSQAVGTVLLGRLRPGGETHYGAVGEFAGAAIVAGAAYAAVGGTLPTPLPAAAVFSIVYFAVLSGVVGYALFFDLVHRSGAVSANLVTYVSPVVALAIGVGVFRESFGVGELAGLALVLAGLALYEAASHPRHRRPATAPGSAPAPEPAPAGGPRSHRT